MDELDHNLLMAWQRVWDKCKVNPAEARRRWRRSRPGTVLDRPHRAFCVAIRASDTRLNETEGATGEEQGDPACAQAARLSWIVMFAPT